MSEALRVLVVDDVRDTADTMAVALTLDGCEVRTATSGRMALEMLSGFEPRVVLLDVAMPNMDGAEFSRILREEHGDRLILIAMTGRESRDPAVLRTMERADHYFRKPVDLDALRRILRSNPLLNSAPGRG